MIGYVVERYATQSMIDQRKTELKLDLEKLNQKEVKTESDLQYIKYAEDYIKTGKPYWFYQRAFNRYSLATNEKNELRKSLKPDPVGHFPILRVVKTEIKDPSNCHIYKIIPY